MAFRSNEEDNLSRPTERKEEILHGRAPAFNEAGCAARPCAASLFSPRSFLLLHRLQFSVLIVFIFSSHSPRATSTSISSVLLTQSEIMAPRPFPQPTPRHSSSTYSLSPAAAIVRQLYRSSPHSTALRTHPSFSPVPILSQRPSPVPFGTIRALGQTPGYSIESSLPVCGEEFFEDNPLLAASIKPQTQQRYSIALENFRDSTIALEPTPMSLDQRVSIYIQERLIANPRAGQRQEMINMLCMLSLMYPTLTNDQLGLARRCIKGWKHLKPSKSAVPFTKELVLALAWYMLTNQRQQSSTILLTSFSACLRISEALMLTWKHVALPGDIRLASYPPGTAGLNIRDAKTARYTGSLQFVQLNDPQAVRFLEALASQGTNPQSKIAEVSYKQYCTDLNAAARHYQLQDHAFTTHSARDGKATEDFIAGVPVQQIAINGRWKSLNSLRYVVLCVIRENKENTHNHKEA